MNDAYAAGFFDGEGTIQLTMTMRAHTSGRSYLRCQLAVSVTQMTPGVLEWFKNTYGGNVYERRPRATSSGKLHRRWDWVATSTVALLFLERIKPYLIVKLEEAECAIEFGHTMGTEARKLGVPQEILDRRAALCRQIRDIRASKTAVAYD